MLFAGLACLGIVFSRVLKVSVILGVQFVRWLGIIVRWSMMRIGVRSV